ncbi:MULTISPECIES: hypothetical protein [Nguyenibacter]|uniref:Uncharacterized protein n=1 Tax=Nguyenibacter vanlangensis TaxID=1216886 RepID=A0A7Y7IVN5_9PROT|nr:MULTISPECIES: hypothetical protein [Nguyenibacter]NVN10621.1 hypothetical protein [Nguyenibacter vanlangensis]WRH88483.1 hypothetical protein QN315_02275 [Nguyenibacter sp. L1]
MSSFSQNIRWDAGFGRLIQKKIMPSGGFYRALVIWLVISGIIWGVIGYLAWCLWRWI